MANKNGPVIDMTPDGDFIEPAKPSLGTIIARVAAFGVVLCVVAVVFWTMLFMLPFVLLLGVVGYFTLRSQIRRQGGVVFRRNF